MKSMILLLLLVCVHNRHSQTYHGWTGESILSWQLTWPNHETSLHVILLRVRYLPMQYTLQTLPTLLMILVKDGPSKTNMPQKLLLRL